MPDLYLWVVERNEAGESDNPHWDSIISIIIVAPSERVARELSVRNNLTRFAADEYVLAFSWVSTSENTTARKVGTALPGAMAGDEIHYSTENG